MSPENSFTLGLKGQRPTSRVTKNIAGVGLCIPVSAGFVYFILFSSDVIGVRLFVLCGQGFSLLWTPALRPFEPVQCSLSQET